jgi:hypothetical protein
MVGQMFNLNGEALDLPPDKCSDIMTDLIAVIRIEDDALART